MAQQCTAKAKSTGERCRRIAVNGYTVCQVHGAGSPNKGRPGGRPIVHGRYSKRLPERLAGKYEEAARDPELLALRDEIALIDARIGELLERIDTGESETAWFKLSRKYADMMEAKSKDDVIGFGASLREIGDIIKAGDHDYYIWHEIEAALEQRRKLTESERKRLVDMQQMITSERAVLLIARIADIIRTHVQDQRTRAIISTELRTLVDIRSGE